ncbi:hypothetical protein F5883DRAFT_559686 [Diaporthe sp. PMI_573]|nr:hypothetical protein F5883DRAFT_559686 [Diaporthaceae sp. PMI_573]
MNRHPVRMKACALRRSRELSKPGVVLIMYVTLLWLCISCRVSPAVLPRATLPFPKRILQHCQSSRSPSPCLFAAHIRGSMLRTALRLFKPWIRHYASRGPSWWSYKPSTCCAFYVRNSSIMGQGFRRDIIQTLNRDQQQAPLNRTEYICSEPCRNSLDPSTSGSRMRRRDLSSRHLGGRNKYVTLNRGRCLIPSS